LSDANKKSLKELKKTAQRMRLHVSDEEDTMNELEPQTPGTGSHYQPQHFLEEEKQPHNFEQDPVVDELFDFRRKR
jgi:hypothetical protein